jgi:hypothetical protein
VGKIARVRIGGAAFIALLFIGLGYLMGLASDYETDHLMLLSSGVTLGLCALGPVTLGGADLDREYSRWKTLLSILGILAGCWAFVGAIFGLNHAHLFMVAPNEFAHQQAIWLTSLPATVCYVLCWVAIWSHYQVAEETIVVLDGRILYPGTRFRLWPWSPSTEKFDQWVRVPPTRMELNFTDGTFEVRVYTAAFLAISTAQERGTSHLDPYAFIREVKDWVLELILEEARLQTLGEFMATFKAREGRGALGTWRTIRGVPVCWTGQAEVALVQ